jgi:cold shock CspA family protein
MDTKAETRLTGVMKWFDPKRGYGWIRLLPNGNHDNDVFAHVRFFRGEFEPMTGDRVSFVIDNSNGRRKAIDIEILGEGAVDTQI